jgi:small Trp-rich protein
MLFVIVGVILVGLNLAGIGPVAQWNFVTPFLLAWAGWAWADASGMTRRREMERDAERKAERRRRNISAMGLGPDAARGGRRR